MILGLLITCGCSERWGYDCFKSMHSTDAINMDCITLESSRSDSSSSCGVVPSGRTGFGGGKDCLQHARMLALRELLRLSVCVQN